MTDCVTFFTEIMLTLFQLLIARKCMGALLGSGKKDIKSILLWIGYFIYSYIGVINNSFRGPILLFGNIICILLIAIVTKQASLKMKFFTTVVIFAMWMMVEVITGLIINAVGMNGKVSDKFVSYISQLFMLIIAISLDKFKHEMCLKDISLKVFLMLFWIPLISVYFVKVIVDISKRYPEYDGFVACVSVVLLLTNYIIFDVYEWMNNNAHLQAENKLFVQQLQLCGMQTKEQEATYKELRRLRHDMKNHLTSLLGMVDSGKNTDAKEYIEKLLSDGKLNRKDEISKTGNIIVDSLINYKYSIAKELKINFNANIFVPIELPFRNENIVIILGNLLENAIEACQKVEEKSRYINIEMTYKKNILELCIKNSCVKEICQNCDGMFLTTKEDKTNHGMGIPSIKIAANEYDGDVLIKHIKNEFVVIVVLYENWKK